MAPTVRSFSGEFDPLALIERHPEHYPCLLESSAPHVAGASFDILPLVVGEGLRLDGKRQLTGPHAHAGSDFLVALEAWWRAERAAPATAHATGGLNLPFSGGWLLYLGYELAQEIEPRLHLPPCPDPLMALALRAPGAWLRDRASGHAWLVYEAEFEQLARDFRARVAALEPPAKAKPGSVLTLAETLPEVYLAAVAQALEAIAAGEVYQANLSRSWQGESAAPIAAMELYRRLRRANPSPFGAYFTERDFVLASSSPERLVALRDGVVTTRPIAGTRPRGASPERDRALIEALLSDEKERAEHIMLVDLERNDVGRVCEGGSVRVDEFMTVETYAHVHHIVSNIHGRQRADASPIDVLRALFPGGSITGCPKVRCMQLIADLEGEGRGAYTGSLGYLNRDGSGDFNILIRTMIVNGSRLRFRTGAGIVADSQAACELAETRAKAEGLLRALA